MTTRVPWPRTPSVVSPGYTVLKTPGVVLFGHRTVGRKFQMVLMVRSPLRLGLSQGRQQLESYINVDSESIIAD
jgi:hypothetical protein